MANLERFDKIVDKYSKLADFAVVYISEAHPEEGWRLDGNFFQIHSHISLEKRMKAASLLVESEAPNCPVIVDSMADGLNKAYGALPERFYIILDGLIVYQGGQGPFGYKLREVEDWLETTKNSRSVLTETIY